MRLLAQSHLPLPYVLHRHNFTRTSLARSLARYLAPVRNLRILDKSAREINQTKTKDYYLYNDSYSLFSFLGFSLEYEEGSRCGHVPEVGKWYQRSKQQAMFIQSIHAVPPLLLLASLFSLLLYRMPLRRPQPPVSYCLSLEVT